MRRALFTAACAAVAACDSADTDARLAPGVVSGGTTAAQLIPLEPGPPTRDEVTLPYEETEWSVYSGSVLYAQLNCAGCHANGGGAIGPPFTDDEWIFGSNPLDIHTVIWQGSPRGMPAYGGRITREQAWHLVAFVRSLAALTAEPLERRPWLHMEGPPVATDPHTAESATPPVPVR